MKNLFKKIFLYNSVFVSSSRMRGSRNLDSRFHGNDTRDGFTPTPNFFIKKNLVWGFTLIELMVAVTIFSLVVVMSLGAVVSILNANRKSQSLESVMSNLNFTLESMSRDLRYGTNYSCGVVSSTPRDCQSGEGDVTVLSDRGLGNVTYLLDSNHQIIRTTSSTGVTVPITAPEVKINNLKFYVTGSDPASTPDTNQPKIRIIIQGTAGTRNPSSFNIQTTVSQRIFDN